MQPFLEGDIFCVGRGPGHAFVSYPRRRPAGASAQQKRAGHDRGRCCRPATRWRPIRAAIAEAVGLVGVVNMEFIRHGDDFFFLEVNPRFSGGVGFSDGCRDGLCGNRCFRCRSGGSVEAFPAAPKHALLARESAIVLTQLR